MEDLGLYQMSHDKLGSCAAISGSVPFLRKFYKAGKDWSFCAFLICLTFVSMFFLMLTEYIET